MLSTVLAGLTNPGAKMAKQYDVFICHASDDKEDFVRPLATALRDLGASVWYDEFSLEIGDSISQKIDKGIANSRFGIVLAPYNRAICYLVFWATEERDLWLGNGFRMRIS